MDYLVAKTKGKRGAFYKVLSDKTTFEDRVSSLCS